MTACSFFNCKGYQVCCWLFRSNFSTFRTCRANLFSLSILPFIAKQAELTVEYFSKPNTLPISVNLCRGAGFLRLDLHQMLTEPSDTLREMVAVSRQLSAFSCGGLREETRSKKCLGPSPVNLPSTTPGQFDCLFPGPVAALQTYFKGLTPRFACVTTSGAGLLISGSGVRVSGGPPEFSGAERYAQSADRLFCSGLVQGINI